MTAGVPAGSSPDAELAELWGADLPDEVSDRVTGLHLAALLRRRLLYVPGQGRHVYLNGYWQPDDRFTAERWAGMYADALRLEAATSGSETAQKRRERVESRDGLAAALAFTDMELVRGADELDRDPHLLNTPDGTLDLRTGRVRAHDPADLLTGQTAVGYDPAATSPLLERFLAERLPDPAALRYTLKVLGSCLVGGNPHQQLLLVLGRTGSGKSTLVEAAAAALGNYARPANVSVLRGNLDDRPRPDLLRAASGRLAYLSEGSQSWKIHADTLKRLTGGDPLVARGMRSDRMREISGVAFTPLVVANVVPRVEGADAAVRRRLRVLRLDLPPGRHDLDPSFKARFVADPQVRAALLAQLVGGCRAALAEGLGDVPSELAAATEEAFGELTHLADFLDWLRQTGQLREVAPETLPVSRCVRATDLHRVYGAWVRLHGTEDDRRERLGLHALGRLLRDLGWEAATSNGVRWCGRELTGGEEPTYVL